MMIGTKVDDEDMSEFVELADCLEKLCGEQCKKAEAALEVEVGSSRRRR